MIDGTGRSIKYLGALQLRLDIPRALARTDDDEEWLVLDGRKEGSAVNPERCLWLILHRDPFTIVEIL